MISETDRISALRKLRAEADDTITLESRGLAHMQYEVPTAESKAFYEAAHEAMPALLDELEYLRGMLGVA